MIPWLGGRLNIETDGGAAFRRPTTVRELELPEAEFPSRARVSLQPLLDQCLRLGFHSPRYYSMDTLRRDVTTSFISMLHRSGEFTIRLMHSIGTAVTPPVESRPVVLLSELHDDTWLFTTDQRPKFRAQPRITGNRIIGADLARLVESHQQELAKLQVRNRPKPVHSIEALDDTWDRYEALSWDFGIQRGLYRRLTPEEVGRELQIVAGAESMEATGREEHFDVLTQISRLQNKKAGWRGAMVLLLVSAGLFVWAGASQWSWGYLLILLPVLFFHELGHYVAMRMFNYRNVRMFFIPFFGAAVAGRHYNVPGWKKVVVSLMGPVPGIILGAIIAEVKKHLPKAHTAGMAGH